MTTLGENLVKEIDAYIESKFGPVFELPEDELGDTEAFCRFIGSLPDDRWYTTQPDLGRKTSRFAAHTYFLDECTGKHYKIIFVRDYVSSTSPTQYQSIIITVYVNDTTPVYRYSLGENHPQWNALAKKYYRLEQVMDRQWKEGNEAFKELISRRCGV